MIAHPLLTDGLGRHGPAAVALALAVGSVVTLAASDPELAALLGCSVRTLQTARTALADAGVLAYNRGRKGRPTEYTSRLARPADPPAVKPKKRTPQATDAMFDVICELAGKAVRHSAPGRVVTLAKRMLKAGLTPEQLESGLFMVLAMYYPWIKTTDLDVITKYWPYILTPPQRAGGDKQPPAEASFARMERTVVAAGGNPLDKLTERTK